MAKRRHGPTTLTGDLAKPITPPPPASRTIRSATTPKARREAFAQLLGDEEWIAAERNRKFTLLFEHYGIDLGDSDSWPKLAIALANEFVPGFQVIGRSGPTIGSGAVNRKELVREVEALTARDGLSLSEACRRIHALRDTRFNAASSAQSLKTAYHQAKRQMQGRHDTAPQAAECLVDATKIYRGVSRRDADRLLKNNCAWIEYLAGPTSK